jgi:hypothetical protein
VSLQPDVEDIQTTRTEKLLAVVLTAFLLLAGLWTYQQLDDVVRSHVRVPYGQPGPAGERLASAQGRLFRAQTARRRARANLELRREAFRTALDAKRPSARLEREYNAAQRELDTAERTVAQAQRPLRLRGREQPPKREKSRSDSVRRSGGRSATRSLRVSG